MPVNKMTEKYNNIKITSRFKKFSPEKKLQLALELYYSARKLKTSSLKTLYPEMTGEEIEKKVREIFLYARS